MKRDWFSFSRSVAFKWIVSYAVIMLIPLFVSAIIYMQTKDIVEYEIQRAGSAMLKQVQYMMDSEVNQAEKLASQLSIYNEVNRYLNLSANEEKSHSFQIYQTRQELGKYRSNNDFIKGIYVYSSSLDKVLTDETYADSRTFYDINSQMIGMPYEDWLADLRGERLKPQDPVPVMAFDRWGSNVVLIKPLTYVRSADSLKGMLMIQLNSSKVQSMLQNVDWVNRGDVYILDGNNKVLFQNNNDTPLAAMSSPDEIQQEAESRFRNMEDTGNMVSLIRSDTTDWKYVSVFPPGVFWEKAREIRNMNLLGLLLCFVVGGIVIWYFARKNYNPVRELVNVLSLSKDEPSRRVLDEFTFIRKHVLSAIRERDDMSSRQFKQMRALQSYYLSRLLKGQAEEGLSLEDAVKLHHFQWESEDFAVLLFYIQAGQEASPSLSLSHFIVSNIIMDFTGHGHRLNFTEVDGMLACVMNIGPERAGKWKEDMEEALVKTTGFIERKYRLHIVMAGSERHTGMGNIHQAYLQALEAQQYRLIFQENMSIWYGDIEPEESGYYLSINDEAVFINLIKTGDLEKSAAMLDEILSQVFRSQSSIELIRCMMVDLASSIMKSIPQEAKQSALWEEWRPLKRLLACTTRVEFREELMELLKMACSKVQEKLSMLSNPGIGEQVTAFVQEHYNDLNLSVSMIGAHFGMTPQYVSRLFKEQTGQGLHDFISQVRTNEAKSLLRQGATIEEIAARVGFASSSAFIRVFKKYEGITPGRFKNLQ
ncbi:AraC family transcriptional regulator [Paenibacillus terreus]|uniref:AraC family transcriptional regulator n=1 Tax=Paenibacillus terreus TaxID=1387834 RepID=A0ABV5BAJ0_9BACL